MALPPGRSVVMPDRDGGVLAWVQHQVGQVVASARLQRALAEGPRGRRPWRNPGRGRARMHHAAPAVEGHQSPAARGGPQRVPGPVGCQVYMFLKTPN